MRGMLNGRRAADVLLHVVVPVVQERSAPQAVEVLATVVAQAVLAEPVAVSARRQARHAVLRLPERLAHVNGQGPGHEDANWTDAAVRRETRRVEVERGVGDRLRARLR